MSEPDAETSVRLNNIDYVVASTGPMDDPGGLERVPVLRIYGTSLTCAKACVHIYQVYPYFYIEYAGSLDPDSGVFCHLPLPPYSIKQNVELTVHECRMNENSQLLHCKAPDFAQPRSGPLPEPEQYKRSSRFIRAIILVKGIHFYGVHYGYSPFLKVLINDPALVSRAVVILQAGSVTSVKLNVFGSHLSYSLQFMCDFGLYGCGSMDLASVSWRAGGCVLELSTRGQSNQ